MSEPFSYSPPPDMPRRSWVPHPLWLLAVAVVLVGAAIACTAYFHPTARLIRDVNALGGSVISVYDGPVWLSELIDQDRLTMFRWIWEIDLDGTDVTDDWLKRLCGRRDLIHLSFSRTRIGDAGIANLQDVPNLNYLGLEGTQISDASLRSLKRFHRLEVISLGETQVTDDGLAHLREMPQLKCLDLNSDAVTDVGLEYLKGLGKLEWLVLSKTRVTNAGLLQLQNMTKLKRLNLNSVAVTDAGLQHLKHSPSLKVLFIGDTQVTPAGIADLKAALPGREIEVWK